MGFLAPVALSLAALSIPVLILYMLKLRRQEQIVSSTMLWQQVLRDRQANAPWQRLRRNLLLLLQLLALALAVMALARPYSEISRAVQGNVVVLLDASASMQAVDASPSRFEVARGTARQLIDGLGPNDTMTLIAVADVPRVLSSLTNDRSVLRGALSSAQVSNAEADWEAAFILAAASAQQARRTTTFVLSDGGIPAGLPALAGGVRYLPIGTSDDNRAIEALAIRDAPEGPEALLRISNAGTQAASTLVEVYADGDLFEARSLSIAAGGQETVLLWDLPRDLERLEARLDHRDRLALDDTSWAVRPRMFRAPVLLVTAGNMFLERAIGLIPHLEPTIVRATEGTILVDALTSTTISPTLYVYDGVLPDRLPETGNLLLIDPPGPAGLYALCGTLSRPQITHVEADASLLQHVDLTDVQIASARCIEPPSWARTLVAAADKPLLLAGEVGGRRIAILAFDLHQSNLPLQVAFPILVANLSTWLAPASAIDTSTLVGGTATLRPGAPVSLRPQVGADEIIVRAPSGREWRYPTAGGESIPFAETRELGIYTVEQPIGDETAYAQFAVNLFSELESDIAPRERIDVGTVQIDREASLIGRREWWRWPALAALALLVVEWVVYWRVSVPRTV